MRSEKAKYIAYIGLMMALVIALSFLEHVMLPPLPGLPPGVSLGLANIVVMYLVFFSGKRWAFCAAVLKAGLGALLRGPTAGLLSLCGGLLSLLAIVVLLAIFGSKISYIAISVGGAVAHNLGQVAAVSVLLGSRSVFYYLPVLVISGAVMGTVTGIMLGVLMPVFRRMFGRGPL